MLNLVQLLGGSVKNYGSATLETISIPLQTPKKLLERPLLPKISEIIDVRSPLEFSNDHIPGAINLPLLSNHQRSYIGQQYKKSKFEARKTGAEIITANISEHIKEHFVDKSHDYIPLVYCERGRLRSSSLAAVLQQIGFEVFTLDEGYKHYRGRVRDTLDSLPLDLRFRVISGKTGTGKSLILNRLRSAGEQVLDLEDLAKHKGSVLGEFHNEAQPTQKYFDSLICKELLGFNPDRTVWIESESRRIGKVTIPRCLFEKLKDSQRIVLVVPIEERIAHILKDYPNLVEAPDAIRPLLQRLVRVVSADRIAYWNQCVDKRWANEFVDSMLQDYYDRLYQHSQEKNCNVGVKKRTVSLDKINADHIDNKLQEILNEDC